MAFCSLVGLEWHHSPLLSLQTGGLSAGMRDAFEVGKVSAQIAGKNIVRNKDESISLLQN